MPQKVRYFRVAYIDDDIRKFGLSEVMCNDDPIHKRTTQLHNEGRNVHIGTATDLYKTYAEVPSIESLSKTCKIAGYEYDPSVRW